MWVQAGCPWLRIAGRGARTPLAECPFRGLVVRPTGAARHDDVQRHGRRVSMRTPPRAHAHEASCGVATVSPVSSAGHPGRTPQNVRRHRAHQASCGVATGPRIFDCMDISGVQMGRPNLLAVSLNPNAWQRSKLVPCWSGPPPLLSADPCPEQMPMMRAAEWRPCPESRRCPARAPDCKTGMGVGRPRSRSGRPSVSSTLPSAEP